MEKLQFMLTIELCNGGFWADQTLLVPSNLMLNDTFDTQRCLGDKEMLDVHKIAIDLFKGPVRRFEISVHVDIKTLLYAEYQCA